MPPRSPSISHVVKSARLKLNLLNDCTQWFEEREDYNWLISKSLPFLFKMKLTLSTFFFPSSFLPSYHHAQIIFQNQFFYPINRFNDRVRISSHSLFPEGRVFRIIFANWCETKSLGYISGIGIILENNFRVWEAREAREHGSLH